jgi:uncharacterized protein YjbI with pentapeptide repeats
MRLAYQARREHSPGCRAHELKSNRYNITVQRTSRGQWVAWLVTTVGVLSAIALLVLLGWFWWTGVPELYRDDRGVDQSAVAATRTGLLAGLVGLGALGTLWLNSRTFRITSRTFELTEQGQLTDRFAKANELLGDKDSPAVRLGGIYALKQLSEDTGRISDQAAVVEVLSAFVRMNFKVEPDAADKERDEYDPVVVKRGKPETDVLAAISVLAQLPDRNIMRADFTGVDFSAADLTGARLRDGNLRDANLRKAGLAGMDLSGINLRGADLGFALLSEANFERADLRDANLRRAYLKEAKFRKADLRKARIVRVIMPGANFSGADLRGADLYDGVLSGGDLRGAKVSGANFRDLTLVGTNVAGVDFRKARGLSQEQIENADGNERTKLPDWLKRPTSWPSGGR